MAQLTIFAALSQDLSSVNSTSTTRELSATQDPGVDTISGV